jgi:DNA polymerase
MSLQLDARQRAMLEEMGIRVFWPEPVQVHELAEAAPVRPDPKAARVDAPAARPEPVEARRVAAPARPPAAVEARVAEPPLQIPTARAPLPAGDLQDWEALQQAVADGSACGSCAGGRKPVFGIGDRQADLLVVGDPPGEQEEELGEPFAGDAGKLLDNMLASLGLSRHKGAYLTNVLKCRPPGNRNPEPQELADCEPVLRRQVQLLRPKVIVVMGRFAVPALLGTNEPIGKLRGRVHAYEGVPLVVTYHPAYLLRSNLPDKARVWADLVLAQSVLRAGAR